MQNKCTGDGWEGFFLGGVLEICLEFQEVNRVEGMEKSELLEVG